VTSQEEDAELGAMTVKEFCRRYRIGTTKFYEEIKAGRLRAVKCGARTLVLNRDSRAWEHTLSAISPPQSATA
jgi:excisionase family DNA binding protein